MIVLDTNVISEAMKPEPDARVGLTQEEVAQLMQTTQSNIARLEAGRTSPSTRTLKKFAAAIGARLSTTSRELTGSRVSRKAKRRETLHAD